MKLEFADDRINEYSNGPLHFMNDGSDIEVSAATASDLLNATHQVAPGEIVKVFKVAEPPKKVEKKEERTAFSTYPENFPSAALLAGAGLTHEEAILLDREQLMEINGVGEKSADAILEFLKEK